MSLHPKTKMEMMPLSAWTRDLWREEVVERWQAAWSWGSSCKWDWCVWGVRFPFFPGQAGGSQAAGAVGAGRLWDGAHFAQLAALHTLSSAALIHPERSGLRFSTPLGQRSPFRPHGPAVACGPPAGNS